MHRSKRKRNIIIFSLIGVLLCMVAGYAAFQTQLKVTGSSTVTSNWDIEITNVTAGTPTGSAENAVAPSFDKLWASMEANLYDKGDAMEYDVTIENKGTLDAKLNDILTNLDNSNNEAVIITFSGYTKGEILKAGNTKIVHVKIEYNPEYEGGETSSEVEINFDYTQDNKSEDAPKTYLLTYDYQTNGGERVDSEGEYLTSGNKVDLSNKAYKNGWNFVGWNTDKDAIVGLKEYQMPTQNTILYAIYSKTLSITYQMGSNIESIGQINDNCNIYNNGTSCEITLPSITAKNGYSSVGWSMTNGDTTGTAAGNKITISDNNTYYANAIDNIKPTLPSITNSSNGNWTSESVTITLTSKDEGSGIDHYEWYENGAWTTRELTTSNGVGTITFTANRNATIQFRAVDKAGNISEIATTPVKIDTSNPTLTVSTTATTKSITVVATASATSGIAKYEYSKDGGKTWVTGTGNTYTFNSLTQTTSYSIMVRVTSGSGKMASTTKATTTATITKPTFKEAATSTGKTVTITYPSGCGSTYTCTYQKDNGSSVTVKSTTASVAFTANGSLVAKVSDGTNSTSSSYTVSKIVAISVGSVRGGSASLPKSKAVIGESITFTASPSSDFTYQGATVVCNNGTQYKVASNSKKFTISTTACTSAVLYPSWKKNDKTILNGSSRDTTFSLTKYDTNADKPFFSDEKTYYAIQSKNPSNVYDNSTKVSTRGQITSAKTYNISDYSKLRVQITGSYFTSGGSRTLYFGVIRSTNTWLHGTPTSPDIFKSFSLPASTISVGTWYELTLNQKSNSNKYYIGLQYLSLSNASTLNLNAINFTGQTYSYTNRGV